MRDVTASMLSLPKKLWTDRSMGIDPMSIMEDSESVCLENIWFYTAEWLATEESTSANKDGQDEVMS